MKALKNNLRSTAVIAVMFFSTSLMLAQVPPVGERGPRPNQPKCELSNILPDLSVEQKGKIDNLRVLHLEKTMALKADMNVLHAELKQLSIAKKPDTKKVNAKIDEIAAKKAEIMKENFNHKQSVRDLLTDEQRVVFDSRPKHQFNNRGARHGNGMHNHSASNDKFPRQRKGRS